MEFELGFHKARADRAEKRANKEAGEKRELERKLIDAKRRKRAKAKNGRKGKIPTAALEEIVARLRAAGTKEHELSGKACNALKVSGIIVTQRTVKDAITEIDKKK